MVQLLMSRHHACHPSNKLPSNEPRANEDEDDDEELEVDDEDEEDEDDDCE